MLIISNHITTTSLPVPNDAIMRVNLAWMRTKADAELALTALSQDVYLDFPQGRTKPPKPSISLDTAIKLANDYVNVKYFAVSNIESSLPILGLQKLLRKNIEVVPKIETRRGIANLNDIVEKTGVKYLMFDKEDLYTDVDKDAEEFDRLVDVAREKCKKLDVKLLELQGVIFA